MRQTMTLRERVAQGKMDTPSVCSVVHDLLDHCESNPQYILTPDCIHLDEDNRVNITTPENGDYTFAAPELLTAAQPQLLTAEQHYYSVALLTIYMFTGRLPYSDLQEGLFTHLKTRSRSNLTSGITNQQVLKALTEMLPLTPARRRQGAKALGPALASTGAVTVTIEYVCGGAVVHREVRAISRTQVIDAASIINCEGGTLSVMQEAVLPCRAAPPVVRVQVQRQARRFIGIVDGSHATPLLDTNNTKPAEVAYMMGTKFVLSLYSQNNNQLQVLDHYVITAPIRGNGGQAVLRMSNTTDGMVLLEFFDQQHKSIIDRKRLKLK